MDVGNELEWWESDGHCCLVHVPHESSEPRSFASLNVELEGEKKFCSTKVRSTKEGFMMGTNHTMNGVEIALRYHRDGVISTHVIGSMC